MVRSHARSATKRAGEKVLRIDGRQHVSNAPLEYAIPDARHPQRAQLRLPRLRDVGPTHRRWPVALGVHHAQRGFTPDGTILLQFVRCLAITARRRVVRHAAKVRPEPLDIDMMRHTGKAELWLLPSFGGYPFESCWHAWGVPLLA
jgi:hypothetical protein